MNNNTVTFPAVTSIAKWAGLGKDETVRYWNGDYDFPFVKVGDLFQYFTKDSNGYYTLRMTSLIDFNEEG